MSKREMNSTFYEPSSMVDQDGDYETQRSRKRSKIFDSVDLVSPAHRLTRRGSSTSVTNYSMCNNNAAVAQIPISNAVRVARNDCMMDSREQGEARMGMEDEVQEMRDLTETMRDMVSIRGCEKSC